MASSKQFLIFSDIYCFLGFITQILYNLIPIAFIYQLKHNVLNRERISCVGISCLFGNAFIYFFISFFKRKPDDEIDPLDFCNLAGAYLGFVYIILYIYYVYCKVNQKLSIVLISILVFVSSSIFLIIMFTVDSNEDNISAKLFNWIGVIFNVLENLPIGFNIVYLIKNKISEKFTLFGAFFGIINEITWLAWAIHGEVQGSNLKHSIVANIIGICIHITQFFIFFKFRKHEDIGEKKDDKINGIDNQDNNNLISNLETTQESKEPDYIKDFL